MKQLVYTFLIFALFAVADQSGLFASFHSAEYCKVKNGPVFSGQNIFSSVRFDYTTRNQGSDSDDRWELRPGIGYAFTSWVYLGLQCVLGKYGPYYVQSSKRDKYENPSMMLDSVQLDLIFAMSDQKKVPVTLAMDVFYRIPTSRSEDVTGRDHYAGFTIIFSEGFGKGHDATVNFTYARDGEKDLFEWGTGTLFQVAQTGRAAFKVGIEFWGDFSGHSAVIPGIYVIIDKTLSIKSGFFIGLSQYTDDHNRDGNKEDDLNLTLEMVKQW